MKRSVRTLSACAAAGILIGLSSTVALADSHSGEAGAGAKTSDNGCNGKDANSCKAKANCKAEEAKDKESCSGKDGCNGKDSCDGKDQHSSAASH